MTVILGYKGDNEWDSTTFHPQYLFRDREQFIRFLNYFDVKDPYGWGWHTIFPHIKIGDLWSKYVLEYDENKDWAYRFSDHYNDTKSVKMWIVENHISGIDTNVYTYIIRKFNH